MEANPTNTTGRSFTLLSPDEMHIKKWHRQQAKDHRDTAKDMRECGAMSMAENVDIVAKTHERAADAIERGEHR